MKLAENIGAGPVAAVDLAPHEDDGGGEDDDGGDERQDVKDLAHAGRLGPVVDEVAEAVEDEGLEGGAQHEDLGGHLAVGVNAVGGRGRGDADDADDVDAVHAGRGPEADAVLGEVAEQQRAQRHEEAADHAQQPVLGLVNAAVPAARPPHQRVADGRHDDGRQQPAHERAHGQVAHARGAEQVRRRREDLRQDDRLHHHQRHRPAADHDRPQHRQVDADGERHHEQLEEVVVRVRAREDGQLLPVRLLLRHQRRPRLDRPDAAAVFGDDLGVAAEARPAVVLRLGDEEEQQHRLDARERNLPSSAPPLRQLRLHLLTSR